MAHLLVATWLILTPASAYIIEQDVGVENNCFFETVEAGTKLGFMFEVLEGGFYDIDIKIKGPQNNVLHSDSKASDGRFTIEADTPGSYSICFDNSGTTASPKTIMFQVERSDSIHSGGNPNEVNPVDDETKKLGDMVQGLLTATLSSRHDVRFLTARDRVHRNINDTTNSRLVWWSAIEFFLLLAVTVGQVWYLKRFFEIRRKV